MSSLNNWIELLEACYKDHDGLGLSDKDCKEIYDLLKKLNMKCPKDSKGNYVEDEHCHCFCCGTHDGVYS